MAFNILVIKDDRWQAAEYEGYFEINLLMIEYWYEENRLIYNSSIVKTHKCTEKDRNHFYTKTDF